MENIDSQDCPHDGLFDSSCDRCRNCELRQECHWLSCLNNFSEFASKPTYTMNASLLFCINLIEARIERMQHDSKACNCESCTWTRDAQQLTREFQTNRLNYQYGSTH
jgi:hypothetical protein